MQLKKINLPVEWWALRKLYRKAFPKCEQKPLWLVWLVKQKRKADVWIAEKDGEFAGFAITMNGADLVLLDYLAVAEKFRGTGVGTEILKALQMHYHDRRLFLEIENVYEEADNRADRLRRKQFYLKNNMQEMKIMVNAFGAELELLTYDCQVSYEEYYELYCSCYGKWAAINIVQLPYPGEHAGERS